MTAAKPVCPRAVALNAQMRRAARERAQAAIAGTPGGAAEARKLLTVPADEAGQVYLSAADGLIAHIRECAVLTPRQCDAAAEMARLYGISGGRRPWARSDGSRGDSEQVERIMAAAAEAFRDALDAAPKRAHAAVITLCQGEWPVSYDPRPLWREAYEAIADRMRLAR